MARQASAVLLLAALVALAIVLARLSIALLAALSRLLLLLAGLLPATLLLPGILFLFFSLVRIVHRTYSMHGR